MKTPDVTTVPLPAAQFDCPWCGGRLEADLPLAETLRCDGCAIELEFAPDDPRG